MKNLVISMVALIPAPHLSFASDSTFSKDFTNVYLVNETRTPELIDINLKLHGCRALEFGKWFSEGIQGIALSDSGAIYCATENAVWLYNPNDGTCTKFCDSPEGKLHQISFNPKSKQLFGLCYVDDEPILHLLPKDDSQFGCIRNRYSNYARVVDPEFASDGSLFFASYGDLWESVIDDGALVGYRCAPIAELITENTSPASTGIRSIAVGRNFIYANDARMGGSGWGSVIRFKRPEPIPKDQYGDYTPGAGLKNLLHELQSVETVADGIAWNLCSSPDGSSVFFATGPGFQKSEIYVVKGDGKPVTVKINGLAGLLFPK
jgi:hypothetical protein